MICPYNHMKIAQVTREVYEYNTDGQVIFHENKLLEKRSFGDCQREECALWVDGKCRYNITQIPFVDTFDDLLGCEDLEDEDAEA